jgi:hypothetical protein
MADVLPEQAASAAVSSERSGDHVAYWLAKPPEERLRGVELMRRALYGYGDPPPRLQRVLQVVERTPDGERVLFTWTQPQAGSEPVATESRRLTYQPDVT